MDKEIVRELQETCFEVFETVIPLLKMGMSEFDLAEIIRRELRKRGIIDFWYDVPIFVLFGQRRFLDIASENYPTKSPHKDTYLKSGEPIYIDIHPQDHATKIWGDWNSMLVFHPRKGIDDEQVAFLEEIREIQREGFSHLRSTMTAADVAKYYLNEFEKHAIVLSDVRNNVGHSMHSGPKLPEKRLFLEKKVNKQLGSKIYAIEPGGYRNKKSSEGIVVGRFEECVFIPKEGKTIILGSQKLLPLIA